MTTDPTQVYRKQRRLARTSALQFLYQADVQDHWEMDEPDALERHWMQTLDEHGANDVPQPRKARGYMRKLIEGVCQYRDELDEEISRHAANWQLKRMTVVDRNILRLAAFEIFHCPGTPSVTAVNEAVELAKGFGDAESGSFVNGILDSLLRDRKTKNGNPPHDRSST